MAQRSLIGKLRRTSHSSLVKKLGRTTPFFDYTNCEGSGTNIGKQRQERDLDITGLSYQILEDHGPNNGLYPGGAKQGTTRHTRQITCNRKMAKRNSY